MAQPIPPPIIPVQVGPVSTITLCPSCRASVRTNVRHDVALKTHLMALLLCCCFCWPCVCVPYCVDSCKDANHFCPACNAFIGMDEVIHSPVCSEIYTIITPNNNASLRKAFKELASKLSRIRALINIALAF
ncbi:hypothetical protein HA402_016036 [Bradysia odoriphaga]|nr:hypothetical protein HA402_016036 [Bradysia odoriphaga]